MSSSEPRSTLNSSSSILAEPAVTIRGLTKTYGARTVLGDIDLDIDSGQFVAVLGPSGTGKTTLLRILSGLEEADHGEIVVPEIRSVVFQEPRLVPAQRAWRNVVLDSRRTRSAQKRARAALAEVGLADKASSWPGTLSGGEAQRVALARALAREPGLLLLDEPFAALDALTRIKMHSLVRKLCAVHHPAVVLVTHDVDEAIMLSDRVIVLSQGSIQVDIPIPEGAARDRSEPWFLELRSSLLHRLGVESD